MGHHSGNFEHTDDHDAPDHAPYYPGWRPDLTEVLLGMVNRYDFSVGAAVGGLAAALAVMLRLTRSGHSPKALHRAVNNLAKHLHQEIDKPIDDPAIIDFYRAFRERGGRT
jgi:hypothetical protein